ncbi:VOC family protein [Methanolobus sp. ZRKC2]|uniref:VOC family protein n=1 Tax=Methanolobus sp. ZRKC2 TaxID=3125783 RepID=UPI00325278FE
MRFVCSLIVVNDIETSRDFYENLLGQKVEYDHGENVVFEGGFAIHLKEHYKSLLGQEHSRILKKSNNFDLYFETDDIGGIFHKLKDTGVDLIHDIREQPWGQRVTRFYDPDHHIVEVGETMESVVLRYHDSGMSIEEISDRTFMPGKFVEMAVSKTG